MFHNFKIFAKIQNFFKSTKFFCLHLKICFMECVPLCGFGVHLPVLFFVTTCRQAEGTYSIFATGRYVFSVTSPRDGLVLEPLLQSVWRRWRLRRGGGRGWDARFRPAANCAGALCHCAVRFSDPCCIFAFCRPFVRLCQHHLSNEKGRNEEQMLEN